MIKVLQERFGEANQSDKYRFELSSRRRRPKETLRNLHSDIRRLTALALPNLEHRAREIMACDYFIDALGDPNFDLKVRERFPKDPDTALQVALQLEVWSKYVDQSTRKERRAREIAEPGKKNKQTDMLKKQVAELQKQLAELQKKDQTASLTKGVAELEAHLTEAKSSTATASDRNTALPRATTEAIGPRPTEFIPPRKGTCLGCRDPDTDSWPARSSPMLRKESSVAAKSAGLASTLVPYASSSGTAKMGTPTPMGLVAQLLEVRPKRAVESASQSTERKQLNVEYDTDTEPVEVMDSEQSELEEQNTERKTRSCA